MKDEINVTKSAAIQGKKDSLSFRIRRIIYKERTAGIIMSLPFIVGFLVFLLVPMLLSFYYSLCDYNIIGKPKFIGLGNYIKFFTDDPVAMKALTVTLKYAIFAVPLRVLFALLVAVLLVKSTKMTPIYRAMYYLPSLLGSSVAVAILWKQIFGNQGLINLIFNLDVKWLGNVKTAIWVLILLSVWQFGSSMLIFVSNMKQIPSSLYEAAKVDGGSSIQNFFKITLPLLTPTIFFNLVMQLINGLLVFSQGQIITAGKPLNSTLFYVLYMYQQSFDYNNLGYASAMGWVLLVVVSAFTALMFVTKKYWVHEGEV